MKQPPFLPTTPSECRALGWENPDIILVTGDAYLDSYHMGVAVIGRVLVDAGFTVAVIPQPDVNTPDDITRLGEPNLFWGVTAGCMDSMVANSTASGKRRRSDDLTPGGVNNRRPDMAGIIYTNLIRGYFKKTRPIVLGGMEASLRRISHYDFKTDKIRRSILFDAKADLLVYGMGERAIVQIAHALKENHPVESIRGICWISSEKIDGFLELPPHSQVAADPEAFSRMFKTFYQNQDPITASGLMQQQDTRYLIQNRPQPHLTTAELDRIHELGYSRALHPEDRKRGTVRGLETIRFSLTTHRGCYGGCHFCGIAAHQGATIIDRSEASICKEAREMTRHPDFKGIISDVGGPTANMYGIECRRKKKLGSCQDRRCMGDEICENLRPDHSRQMGLLSKLREIPGVKRLFIGSGIRYDLILADTKKGEKYLRTLLQHHVSGQLKVAPEHSENSILKLMGKPPIERFIEFKKRFDAVNRQLKKEQFLTCYFIAAYPGCTVKDMERLSRFCHQTLKFKPRQIQIFTPTPATPGTLMYYMGRDYETDRPIFVEKRPEKKERQKAKILK